MHRRWRAGVYHKAAQTAVVPHGKVIETNTAALPHWFKIDDGFGGQNPVYDMSQDMQSPVIKSSMAAAQGHLFVVGGSSFVRRLYCFGQ